MIVEGLDLEHVGSVDWLRGEGCYEWDETTVMYHSDTDTFYWEYSGGCSCNYPLGNVSFLEDLESGSFHDLAKHITDTLSATIDNEEGVLAMEATRVIEAAIRIREGN